LRTSHQRFCVILRLLGFSVFFLCLRSKGYGIFNAFFACRVSLLRMLSSIGRHNNIHLKRFEAKSSVESFSGLSRDQTSLKLFCSTPVLVVSVQGLIVWIQLFRSCILNIRAYRHKRYFRFSPHEVTGQYVTQWRLVSMLH
jgi:hypothetical protein